MVLLVVLVIKYWCQMRSPLHYCCYKLQSVCCYRPQEVLCECLYVCVVVNYRSWQVLSVSAGRQLRCHTQTTARRFLWWWGSRESRSFDTSTTSGEQQVNLWPVDLLTFIPADLYLTVNLITITYSGGRRCIMTSEIYKEQTYASRHSDRQ